MKLLRCPKCKRYTLSQKCKKCGVKTVACSFKFIPLHLKNLIR